jgi:hypothetical protein
MKPEDEPALKRSADAASARSQAMFLRLSVVQLLLLGLAAIVSGYNPLDAQQQRVVAIATFLLMVAALAVSIALKLGRFDDKWFRCRSAAENVKSAMWYFVMASEERAAQSEQEYQQRLQDIQQRIPGLAALLAVDRVQGAEITDWMLRTRSLTTPERLKMFVEGRLQNQIDWYQSKAKENAENEVSWQWTVFVLEFIAIVYAALQAWKLWPFNAVGAIAAISAALVAWSQTKRFSDLANSYAVAAEDLRRIATGAAHVVRDDHVRELVREVETAISREHSMWFARRAS